jgi:hypothetical protein
MKIGNIEVPLEVIEGVRMVPASALGVFFENLRRDFQGQITATPESDLSKLKAKVECVNTVEQLFLEITRLSSPPSF